MLSFFRDKAKVSRESVMENPQRPNQLGWQIKMHKNLGVVVVPIKDEDHDANVCCGQERRCWICR